MGLVNSDVENRSFLMQIAKELRAAEIDEMKFLLEGEAVDKMRLKSASVCEFVRILGEQQYWSFYPTVNFFGFALLCKKLKRHDLAKHLKNYEERMNSGADEISREVPFTRGPVAQCSEDASDDLVVSSVAEASELEPTT